MQNRPAHKKQSIVSQKDLSLVLRIIKDNWWVPFIIIPIFYGIGKFYIYKLTNIYTAKTEFLLKSNDTYYQNTVVSEANFYSYGTYVDNLNEIRIIQSYDLAYKVVNRLLDRLQVSYFIVGKVRTTEQFSGMPFKVKVSAINDAHYEIPIDLRIIDYNSYEITFELNNAIQKLKGQFNKPLENIYLPILIERSETFTPETVTAKKNFLYQFTIHKIDNLIAKLREDIKVENPEYTQIITVELKDVIPDRAVLILDTLNGVYAQGKLKTKYDLNDRTVEYIDRQLNEITYSLKNFEDSMQNYKEAKSIIDLDWQQGDFLNKIGTYDNQRSALKLQIEAYNDLEEYIIQDKDPQFLPPSVFIAEKGGFMNTAATDLYNRQIELNRLANIAKENNPLVVELKSTIKKTKQDLLVYIANARKATQQQIQNVNNEIITYIAEAKQIPGKQQGILNIQRKANVNEQLYNFLLEKKASTKIARASIVPDVKIIEAPRYIGIDSPNKPEIEKRFFSFGLIVVVVIIFLRAFLFAKIKTVEHLKELTDLPLVGALPKIKPEASDGIVVENEPNSMITEAFRNFRTNLQYANVGVEAKTFLVTSFLPGEGKTFTSSNLAAMLAKSGKKTVLLELDLHKPRIYKRFGLPEQKTGITTYVLGQNSINEIIKETSVQNLNVIFCGPIPPNPSDLVLSEKLKVLIEYAKANFDYVIIDTPPAGLLSDSLYLIQYVDASIFVLNTRSSSKRVINFLEEVIANNNLSNVLLLLNGIKRAGSKYYYKGYGYSYGYGYGKGYGYGYRK